MKFLSRSPLAATVVGFALSLSGPALSAQTPEVPSRALIRPILHHLPQRTPAHGWPCP